MHALNVATCSYSRMILPNIYKMLSPAGGLVLLGLSMINPVCADDLEQNLVAKWTFKDGSLTSEVGDFTFIEGTRGLLETGKGSVTLRDRKYLIVPEISSATFPDLARSVTIWARLRFDQLPSEFVGNLMGLQSVPKSGSWDHITLAVIYRSVEPEMQNPGLCFLGKLPDGLELGVGPSRFIPVAAGDYVNVALVFDAAAHRASLWVNGQMASSERPSADQLQQFDGFGIGQLMSPGASYTVTFDEVRIYSTALDAGWIDEISPSKD